MLDIQTQSASTEGGDEPSQLQKRLITQAEKSMQLAQKLGEAKDELEALKRSSNDLRGAMVTAIKVALCIYSFSVQRGCQ